MNWSSLAFGRTFVNPSAGILSVSRYWTLNVLFWTSYRAQTLWISTWRRAVYRRSILAVTNRIVYWLSHQITMSSYKWNRIPANNHMVAITSLLAFINARSSVSVEDVVTVSCFDAFQAIGDPYKVII